MSSGVVPMLIFWVSSVNYYVFVIMPPICGAEEDKDEATQGEL